MKLCITLALAAAGIAAAQQPRDYELRCRQEASNRLRANRDDITTGIQDTDGNNSRVSWTYRDRNGYCLIDPRMNIAEFHEFNANDNNRRERVGNAPAAAPISNVPKVKVNTAGRGNFSGPQTVKITRGWVDTKTGTPAVTLSGEHDSKSPSRATSPVRTAIVSTSWTSAAPTGAPPPAGPRSASTVRRTKLSSSASTAA